MEIVMFKNRNFFPHGPDTADLSRVLNGLQKLIEDFKVGLSRTKDDINSTILLNTPGKQIVLTALHKGTEVYSFQSKDSITFEVIEGTLLFHVGKKTTQLDKGQSLSLYENVEYSLKALDETMFLLTISSETIIAENPE